MKSKIDIRVTLFVIALALLFVPFSGIHSLTFMSFGLNVYYFTFIFYQLGKINLKRSNFLSVAFLDTKKMPMYLATLTAITLLVLRRNDSDVIQTGANVSIVIGFAAGIIAMFVGKSSLTNTVS